MAHTASTRPAGRLATWRNSEAWRPLARPLFLALWAAVLLTNIGNWMETVGAQWLIVSRPNSGLLVALVQTADTLPVMILALPAGVLADVFDRRVLLLVTQVFVAVVAIVETSLTAAGLITPALLLVITLLNGAASGITAPAWQAMIPDILERSELRAAAVLSSVSVNIGRAIGPAVAGILIAFVGVAPVFGVNAATLVMFSAVLLWIRVPTHRSSLGRERFVPALRAGRDYVRWSPYTRTVLVRAALFLLPAIALWALLPLVATNILALDAAGYGILLAALGTGAIVGVVVVGRFRRRVSDDRLIKVASVMYAATMAALVLVPNLVLAVVVLLVAGGAWLAVLSTVNATLQLFLPTWVRARGLAVYVMVLFGAQAIGAASWGLVAQFVGVFDALLVAAAVMVVLAIASLRWPLRDVSGIDRTTVAPWPEARLAFRPDLDIGPVLISTEYVVPAANAEPFIAAMESVGRSRRRSGASNWNLYRDGADPRRFVETFEVPSWDVHLRQHVERLTGSDAEAERRAESLATSVSEVRHLFPADEVE